MQTVALTWRHVLSVWWLVTWRGTVGGLLIGCLIGLVWSVIAMVVGAPLPAGPLVSYAMLPVGIAWQYVVVGWALKKKYKSFRIVLVENSPAEVF